MNAARFLALVAASLAVSLGRVALAAGPANVALSIVACDRARVPAEHLVELVRSEVAPAVLSVLEEPSARSGEGAVRGAIELCYGSPERARVALSLGSKTSLERVVDLSDVAGELRVRTLAVVFAEMLLRFPALTETDTASSAKTGASPRAEPRSENEAQLDAEPDVPTTPRATAAQRASESRRRVGAGLAVRSYTEPQTTSLGPWLSVEFGPWQTEALFLTTKDEVATGTVSLHDLVAAVGWAPLEFGSAVRVILGVRAELGMTWAHGSPRADSGARGSTERRARAALLAEPRIDVALSSVVSVEARLSAGLAHGPTATADHDPVATSSGPFVGTALGLQVGF